MEKIQIRPRFQYSSSLPPEKVLQCLHEAVSQVDTPVKGLVMDQHVYLSVPEEKQHFWSPKLNLEVEAGAEGSIINGLFGPRETVWLMYVFCYALLGFLILMVTIMGFSQLNLGLSARILWALPVLLILLVLAYGTAKTGQKLGHEEMDLLYKFFLRALEA